MKIEIDIGKQYEELGVKVTAPDLTPEIERIISLMRMMDMQIPVKQGDETVMLDVDKILYIEAVDRNTFVYTKDNTYESALKLYEFEQQLPEKDYIRISKQSILNLRKVKSLKTDINRKIRVTLLNGEQIVVSRMYAEDLRKRLGIK